MTDPLPRPALTAGLVALLAVAPLSAGGTTFVPATVIRLGALALALAWLVPALRNGADWRRPTPIDLPVLLLLGLAATWTIASPHWYESLQGFHGLATGALVLAVAAECAHGARQARLLTVTVAAAGAAQALLALGQGAAGIDRPAGSYFNPNYLGMALVMTGALLLALAPQGRVRSAVRWLAVALVAAALLRTESRGAALAAMGGWGFVAWRRWRWRAVAAAAAIVVALAVTPNPLSARLRGAHARDPLVYSRLQVWKSAIDRTLDHPLGVGLNLFAQSSQRYAFSVEGEVARYGRRAESAHNDYLEVLAELGLPGALLLLWGLAALVLHGARALGAPADARAPTTLGAAGALLGLAVHATVDTPLGVPAIVVQGAALAGVLLAAPVPRSSAAARQAPPWARPRAVRAAIVALGLVAAIGLARHGVAYAFSQWATAARDAGDLPGARRWLERASSLAPDSAAYLDARAAAAIMAWRTSGNPGDAVAAEQLMLAAMRLDPEDANRYARLGQVYRAVTPADPELRRRALVRARALYEQAERLDPHSALFAFERAEVLLRLDDRDGAVAALEHAVALEPRLLPARLNLARLLAARGERGAAAEQLSAIEATLAAYDRDGARRAAGPFVPAFLGVDRGAVRREAERLATGGA